MLEISDSHNLVNGKDFSGRTPIHLAAAAGQYSVLVELSSVAFANIKALDNDGRYMHICRIVLLFDFTPICFICFFKPVYFVLPECCFFA